MSSITIHKSKKDIAPSESADAQLTHHAYRACNIGKCRSNFGWRSDATRKPSRRSSPQRLDAIGALDVRPRVKRLPGRKRFSQQRYTPRGAASGHRTLCSRPLAGAWRMSAGRGGGLRNTPAPLRAGCRLLGEPRESTDGLENESQAVVLLQTSLARRVVLLSATCSQRALLRKTEEVRCMEEHDVCRFESSRSVPNGPATGKEGTDD